MGEHVEKQFVNTEARQRCTPWEKGMGIPTSEEEHSEEVVKSFL